MQRIERQYYLFETWPQAEEVIALTDASGLSRKFPLWYCEMPQAKSRLASHDRVFENPLFQSVESYREIDGSLSMRIYGYSNGAYIPTLVVGSAAALERSAFYDKVPLIPLNGSGILNLDEEQSVRFPNDFYDVPQMREVFENTPKVWYAVRKTTFLLKILKNIRWLSRDVCIQLYQNGLQPECDEYFAIFSPPMEVGLLPFSSSPRLLVTNSEMYVVRHPEREYIKICRSW